MKLSFNSLKDYVDVNVSPEELARDLTLFGHEVEDMEKVGDDVVLNLEITPNRGDCLSVIGLAREVAALYNLKLKTQSLKLQEKTENIDKDINIKVADAKICPRYTARIIDNIKVQESPKWLKDKLAVYGFRPINNIVDVTNYVMIQTGQPLHAFDYNKITNGLMSIRLSKAGDEVITLDGKVRKLPDDSIIIEDSEKIYDLAGIMGGAKSEVDENTKTIVLEGAIFDPVLIRKTAKYLHHMTDASYRYERGVDFFGTTLGLDMASSLIYDIDNGVKIGELVDITSEKPTTTTIDIDIEKVNKLTGIDITISEAVEYLKRLGFESTVNGKQLTVTVPSYRAFDVKIWQDVAEEIARVYGYNRIDKSQMSNVKCQMNNTDWVKREKIKDYLKSLGFTEVYTYSFADKDKIELVGENIEDCVESINPIAPELEYLRPNLKLSILKQIAKNPWSPDVNIFEIGKVYKNDSERWELAIATVGKNDKVLLTAVQGLKLQVQVEKVSDDILKSYKIRKPVSIITIDIEEIKEIEDIEDEKDIKDLEDIKKYTNISKYAPTIRDLAFIVDADIKTDDVRNKIIKSDDNIIIAELFDEFSSDKFGENKKNIAFHVWMQNLDGPVKDEDANKIINVIIKAVEEKYKAKLRQV